MTLAVRSLLLSHFRSHRRAELEFDGRPVGIFGPNGSGKTNLLEAVSLLSPGRGLRRAAVADFARRPEALGWKVRADVATAGPGHEIETFADGDGSRQVRIDGKAAPQAALGRVLPMVWLVPSMDRLWIEAAEGRRRFLDRATLSFEPGHAEAVLAYEKAMRERNRLLKDQVREPVWYDALELQMAERGAEVTANRLAALAKLGAEQRRAATAFPVADLALEGFGPQSAEELRHALAVGRQQDLYAGRTLTGPHRADMSALYADKGVAARDCSTGEQKALLLSLILANARALAARSGTPPIVLLDEVSAHLDADRRASLYDEICALGAQAWMTGTGPELFTDLGERAQLVSVTEEDGESRATQENAP